MDKKHFLLWSREFGRTFLKQGLPIIALLLLVKVFTDWI